MVWSLKKNVSSWVWPPITNARLPLTGLRAGVLIGQLDHFTPNVVTTYYEGSCRRYGWSMFGQCVVAKTPNSFFNLACEIRERGQPVFHVRFCSFNLNRLLTGPNEILISPPPRAFVRIIFQSPCVVIRNQHTKTDWRKVRVFQHVLGPQSGWFIESYIKIEIEICRGMEL